MPAWLVITLVVIAIVALAVVVYMFTVGPWGQRRRLASRRKETQELRREAQQHLARAGEHASAADQEQDRAKYEREEAEDAVRRAGVEAANCAQPPVISASAAGAVAAPVGKTVTVTVTRETFIILADTLFQFDKSAAGDILPGGLQRLGDVAARLKSYKSIDSVTVTGHTDRLGSDAYNDALSTNRAATVKTHLESLGVKAASVKASGQGKRQPSQRRPGAAKSSTM